ncbi:hypothetical protein BDP27DRAFT_1367634 [Rhodocollybia butyracea]|uniref:Uncharacterized protein n=1 Tax=Rhodocollybia butyracea TaxID=206335 RepID=A0A9P5PIP4_9AGAR|nr:hypothetical protein BDP27DRAFT_1367634 [Rhodocollybia butyracea]
MASTFPTSTLVQGEEGGAGRSLSICYQSEQPDDLQVPECIETRCVGPPHAPGAKTGQDSVSDFVFVGDLKSHSNPTLDQYYQVAQTPKTFTGLDLSTITSYPDSWSIPQYGINIHEIEETIRATVVAFTYPPTLARPMAYFEKNWLKILQSIRSCSGLCESEPPSKVCKESETSSAYSKLSHPGLRPFKEPGYAELVERSSSFTGWDLIQVLQTGRAQRGDEQGALNGVKKRPGSVVQATRNKSVEFGAVGGQEAHI